MYLHSTEYKFRHIYDVKTLKGYCDYAERDIKAAEKAIQKIREYQQQLFAHVQTVIETPTKHVVKLGRRENYLTKKIEYFVSVEERPIVDEKHVDGHQVYGIYKDSEKFSGTQRHEAIRYADKLAKQYRATIEREGRWN